MKKINKLYLIAISICFFFVSAYIAFLLVSNSDLLFIKIWGKYNVYEDIKLTKESLLEVIHHTLKYLNGFNDNLQIQVTLTTGETVDFYQNFGEYQGLIMDELGHMADCKVLFIGFRNIAIICLIAMILLLIPLILNRKTLKQKDFNVVYITFISIFVFAILLAVIILLNFDKAFVVFHHLFFNESIYSWEYPWYSRMIIMLPEQLFFTIAILIITFTILFICILAVITRIIQRKIKKATE